MKSVVETVASLKQFSCSEKVGYSNIRHFQPLGNNRKCIFIVHAEKKGYHFREIPKEYSGYLHYFI